MPRRILMIDDDRLQFRLTQAHFKQFRGELFELEWAPTYADGLTRLLSGAYLACLLDYQLGERDGLQLIREAVGKGCRTPIIFLTAESSTQVDIEAMNTGAMDFLVKGELTSAALERSLRYAVKLGETLEALHGLAIRDELTGLLNRREFDRILLQEEERARRFGQTLALVMVDIDHFKAVNDRHGHLAGDAVIRRLAEILRANVRSVDSTARFGGEEFALIIVQADAAAAASVARSLCAAVAETPLEAGGGLSPADHGERGSRPVSG